MVLNGTKIKNVINNVPYRNRYGTYVRLYHFLNHQIWLDFDAIENASKLSQHGCLENDAL